MWRCVAPPRSMAPDMGQFLEVLHTHAGFFRAGQPLLVARAPGRLDVMGGIADYSGSLVLELPLSSAAFVAVQHDPARLLTVYSTNAAEQDLAPLVALDLDTLLPEAGPLPYADACALFRADGQRQWAAHVLGALVVLHAERGLRPGHGIRILVSSHVPVGKGVSSSAALEVAAMQAISALLGLSIDGRSLALLCQQVENLVAGAPCGVMDQMSAACGQADQILALLCQPAELQAPLALPPHLAIWGIDSGIRHAISGQAYLNVRVGAFMGYRIIAALAGLPVTQQAAGRVHVRDSRWHGYLANIPPSLWEQSLEQYVPHALDGASFLARYGGITDPVTMVDPATRYAVRRSAAHPIYEHQRARLFRALLCQPVWSEEQHGLLGELMYQSHASYSACGLGSEGTDRLVELVMAAGPEAGLYGARITGGGSGGMVAVLGHRDAADAVVAIGR